MRKYIIISFLAVLALSCTRGVPPVEEGVSLALARYRSELVSDLRYSLAFSIPEDQSEPVSGEETLSFTLGRKTSLQLEIPEGWEAVANGSVVSGQAEGPLRALRLQ